MDNSIWFAYYDSFFLSINPKLSKTMFEDYFIPNAKWPEGCPNLVKAFDLLQTFIKEPSNWIHSQCKLDQLEEVEEEINRLMQFIAMEKSYAFTFWKTNLRRIQASAVHFYAFLQLFAKAVIPEPTMTLFQCKSINKLCIELANLEKLMNSILKCVNPIAKFFSKPLFSQQQKLLQNFFQNVIYFMKKLPKIKRNKINHIHNLIKFINLINSIEIYTKNMENNDEIKNKSNTISINLYSDILNLQNQFNIYEIKQQQQQFQSKKNKKYLQHYPRSSFHQNNTILPQNHQSKQKHFFQMPIKIMQKAFQIQMAHNITLRNPSIFQQKFDGTYLNKIPISQFNKIIKDQCQKKNSKVQHSNSVQENARNSSVKKKENAYLEKHKTTFEQQCQKIYQNQNMFEPSSKLSEIRKRQLSTLGTSNKYKSKNIKEQQKRIFCQIQESYIKVNGASFDPMFINELISEN